MMQKRKTALQIIHKIKNRPKNYGINVGQMDNLIRQLDITEEDEDILYLKNIKKIP